MQLRNGPLGKELLASRCPPSCHGSHTRAESCGRQPLCFGNCTCVVQQLDMQRSLPRWQEFSGLSSHVAWNHPALSVKDVKGYCHKGYCHKAAQMRKQNFRLSTCDLQNLAFHFASSSLGPNLLKPILAQRCRATWQSVGGKKITA